MATLTVTPSISPSSLSISGTTSRSATISWICPTVQSNAIISSCVLTGTATASMSKGSATIKVNGTTVTSGTQFSINLGTANTTTSVSVTAQGGNKNASGTVTFSNLSYAVTYEIPIPKYTVTFMDWDGTVLKAQTIEEGNSATAPSNPSRDGYRFIGWDADFSNVLSDLTITAQYEEIVPVNIESISLSENDIILDIGMSKKIKAILSPNDATEKCVWEINNDNVSLSVNNQPPENTLILYGQEMTPSIKNCAVNFTTDSFNLISYSASNASVTFEVNGLNSEEVYILSASSSDSIVTEVYHGDTYTAGMVGTNLQLTGFTNYTIVFYNNNGTTSNWSVTNISLVDSNGNDNYPIYNGLEVRITSMLEGTTVLTCKNQDGTIFDTCNITIKYINPLDLGCRRGIFSWVYSDLLEAESLARACNVLNLTEIYQEIKMTDFTQEQFDELSDAILRIKKLTKNNVDVIYLDGDATWYGDPDKIKSRIDEVINFNTTNKNSVTFNKIMLDIEPWSAGITGWYPVYQQTMYEVYEYCKANNFELALVVPFWLDNGIDPTIVTDFHKIVTDLCDDYVCMNYNKNSYLTAMDVEMEYAMETNKYIYSVAECQPVNDTWGVTENLTYYSDGLDVLWSHWKNLNNRYGYNKLGFAYHDFNNAMKVWTEELDITEGVMQSVSFDVDSENLTTENIEQPIIYKLKYSWQPSNADKDFTIHISNNSLATYNDITNELTITGNGTFTVTIICNSNESIYDTLEITSSGFEGSSIEQKIYINGICVDAYFGVSKIHSICLGDLILFKL